MSQSNLELFRYDLVILSLIFCKFLSIKLLYLELLLVNGSLILELPKFEKSSRKVNKCPSNSRSGPKVFNKMMACNEDGCFQLKKGDWHQKASMLQPRVGPASSNYGSDQWMVTGGSLSDGSVLDSTEIYDYTLDKWTEGPALPWPLRDHCQVQMGGEVIITGEIIDFGCF